MSVHEIIACQLTGFENANRAYRRLISSCGAKYISYDGSNDNYLQFRIGRNASKCNLVKIILDVSDTYTMQFISIRGDSVKIKEEFNFVFFDQLQPIFEKTTGMHIHPLG